MLTLLGGIESWRGGRFRVEPTVEAGDDFRFVARVAGRFWVTRSGNAYTAVDMDHATVDAAVTQLLAARSGQALDVQAPQMGLLGDDYERGDEFQLGLADLVAAVGIVATDPTPSMPELVEAPDRCRSALAAYGQRGRRLVDATTPEFVRRDDAEAWRFPASELRAATKHERGAAAQACGGDGNEYETHPQLRFERRSAPAGRLVLEVFADNGESEGPNEFSLFRLVVSDRDGQSSPPDTPRPASMFDPRNYFLLKINECGELPWEYSDFMAGDRYIAPHDSLGPSIFATDFLCHEEVPEDAAG